MTGGSTEKTLSLARVRWGLVRVRITIYNSKITNVDVLQHPDANSRDQAIMSSALPTLTQ